MPIMHGVQHRHTLLYTSNLLGFRICRPHLLRQLRLGQFPPIAEQYLQVLVPRGSIGGAGSLASHLLAALTLHCFAGTARQGVCGFGSDPQMTAVPSITSSVCFDLKGSRRNCSLYPGLPPFSLPCAY